MTSSAVLSPAASRRGFRATLFALIVAVTGCSGDGDGGPTVATRGATTTVVDTPFCQEAVAFNQYLDNNGADLFVPAGAKIYMAETQRRLQAMADLAPEEVVDDIDAIIEAYVELDATLADVGYDLVLVDDQAFQSDTGADASLRLDNFLFDECGFDPLAGVPFEGEKPEVLSEDELGEMIGEQDADDAELVDLLASQFVDEFGLDPESARCLAENMDSDSVVTIASGGVVTEDVQADFVATLETCDIDQDQLAG